LTKDNQLAVIGDFVLVKFVITCNKKEVKTKNYVGKIISIKEGGFVGSFLREKQSAKSKDLVFVQSDQQESKSEQALQIIGHVVAESYANKRSKHGRRQFVVSNVTL
jgi:uncharacterized protein (DUF2225 family)